MLDSVRYIIVYRPSGRTLIGHCCRTCAIKDYNQHTWACVWLCLWVRLWVFVHFVSPLSFWLRSVQLGHSVCVCVVAVCVQRNINTFDVLVRLLVLSSVRAVYTSIRSVLCHRKVEYFSKFSAAFHFANGILELFVSPEFPAKSRQSE